MTTNSLVLRVVYRIEAILETIQLRLMAHPKLFCLEPEVRSFVPTVALGLIYPPTLKSSEARTRNIKFSITAAARLRGEVIAVELLLDHTGQTFGVMMPRES